MGGRWRPLGSALTRLQGGEGGGYSSRLHLKDHLLFLKEPQTWVYILTLLLIYWLGTWRRSLPSLGLSSRGHLWAQSQGPAILLTPHCNFQTVLVPPLQGPLSRDPPPPPSPSSVLSPSNSLDTFPHSLRLPSQLTVSPCTPSPGNVGGDLKIHAEGLFNRPAAWASDLLISRRFTSSVSSQTLTPLAHSRLPCPHQSPFSQSIGPEPSLPCPARPTCLTT